MLLRGVIILFRFAVFKVLIHKKNFTDNKSADPIVGSSTKKKCTLKDSVSKGEV